MFGLSGVGHSLPSIPSVSVQILVPDYTPSIPKKERVLLRFLEIAGTSLCAGLRNALLEDLKIFCLEKLLSCARQIARLPSSGKKTLECAINRVPTHLAKDRTVCLSLYSFFSLLHFAIPAPLLRLFWPLRPPCCLIVVVVRYLGPRPTNQIRDVAQGLKLTPFTFSP